VREGRGGVDADSVRMPGMSKSISSLACCRCEDCWRLESMCVGCFCFISFSFCVSHHCVHPAQHLLRYFTEEAKDKAPLMPFDASEWRLEVVKNVPRQRNGCADCSLSHAVFVVPRVFPRIVQYFLPLTRLFLTDLHAQSRTHAHINSFDCGVFTCKMADYLAEGRSPLAFTQDDMPYFRRRLALEIKIKRVD
jgi:hypothetical protein